MGVSAWLSRDPIGEEGGLNLYSYVGNSPQNFIDPYGLVGWGFALGAGGTAGVFWGVGG